MARAGRLAAEIVCSTLDAATPGVMTRELSEHVDRLLDEAGAESLFRGYRQGESPPFPASACISINDEVVHGVPGDRVLEAGDLVSVDVGLRLDGWCADRAESRLLEGGRGDADRRRLLEGTRQVLQNGIGQIAAGRSWSTVAIAMERRAAELGLGIVREFVGHGIGRELHEPPRVPSFWSGGAFSDFVLTPGLVLAIEPLCTLGAASDRPVDGPPRPTPVRVGPDGWTVRTADGSTGCHVEHTVAITARGPMVLTEAE